MSRPGSSTPAGRKVGLAVLFAGALILAITLVANRSGTSADEAGADRSTQPSLNPGREEPSAGVPRRAAPPTATRRPPGGAEEAIRVRRAERMSRLEGANEAARSKFNGEPVDRGWAAGHEGVLQRLAGSADIAAVDLEPDTLEIDCRSTMCRVDAGFASSGAAEDWTMLFMSSVGADMRRSMVTRHRDPDGGMRVEIYGQAR